MRVAADGEMSLFSMAESTVYIRVALLYPFILRWNPGCFQIFAAVSNATVTKARGWACNAGHSPGARDVGIRRTERASAGRQALPGYAALPPGTARPEAVGKGPREARVAAEQWRVGAGSADLTLARCAPHSTPCKCHRPTDPALGARNKAAFTATGHRLPDHGNTAPRSWRPLRLLPRPEGLGEL